MGRDLIIAHLSDLHFSSTNRDEPKYKAIQTILPNLFPDLITITGDLVDNIKLDLKKKDFRESLNIAKDFLFEICKSCNLDPANRLFVVPGNHDFRYAGIIKSKKDPIIFMEIFRDFSQTKYIQDIDVIVACFDSNSDNVKINFAQGEVTQSEFTQYNQTLNQWKEKNFKERFLDIRKVALLHHHPMPIFRAELPGKGLIDEEGFLILKNSATFMREMIKSGTKLILHGHKHHRGTSKASFQIGVQDFDTIGVISAGSIRKPTKEDEYSFNIVTYFEDGRVFVEPIVARGEGTYDPKPSPITLFNHNEARYSRFIGQNQKARYSVEKSIIIDEILPNSGDWRIYESTENLLAKRGTGRIMPEQTLSATAGMYVREPTVKVLDPVAQKAKWVSIHPARNGVKEGVIEFEQRIDNEPISFEYSNEVPNAISFTKEERKAVIFHRASSHTSTMIPKLVVSNDEERIYRHIKYQFPRKLIWNLQFPKGVVPLDPSIRVTDVDGNKMEAEQEYCSGRFHFSKKHNLVLLDIDYPVLGGVYQIVWNLPSESELYKKEMPVIDILEAEKIKKYFVSLSPKDSVDGKVREWLVSIYNELIHTSVIFGEGYSDTPLEISLSIYDENINKLRYAAFYCPKCTDIVNASIWKSTSMIGHPIPGFAYKRKQAELSLHPTKPNSAICSYIRPPACENQAADYLGSFVAVPLFYPFTSKYLIGVLELATCSDSALLYELGYGTETQKEAKKQSLVSWCNKSLEEFSKRI